MKPTDNELIIAMGEAMGYDYHKGYLFKPADNPGPYGINLKSLGRVDGIKWCVSKDSLDIIWDFVQEAGRLHQYMDEVIRQEDGVGFGARGHVWDLVRCTPRRAVIAALKALGKWPSEWEV